MQLEDLFKKVFVRMSWVQMFSYFSSLIYGWLWFTIKSLKQKQVQNCRAIQMPSTSYGPNKTET